LNIFEYFYTNSYFNSDVGFIKEISLIFVFTLPQLKEKSVKYFDKLNEIILKCYKENKNNIICVRILGILYSDVGSVDKDKKLYIASNFCLVSDHIYNNILSGTSNNQMDLILFFTNFWYKAIEKLSNINIDVDVLHKTITLFCDAIPSFIEKDLHKAILRVLISFISHHGLFPIEIITPIFGKMILAVFSNIEYFGEETLVDLTNLTVYGLAFNADIFLNKVSIAINLVMEKANSQSFKQDHLLIILNYLKFFSRNDKSIKLLLNDIVGIVKGNQQVDCFMTHEIKLKSQGLGLNY